MQTFFRSFFSYLTFFIQLEIRRRKDETYVCAKTLYRWFYSFVTCIASYCFDGQDGQLAGSVLLVNSGLYNLEAINDKKYRAGQLVIFFGEAVACDACDE